MPRFENSPHIRGEHGEGQVRRYVHQPITLEHFGIHASIQANGKIIITGPPKRIGDGDEVEYDEIEIPASLVFKLAMFLKSTRSVEYVTVKPSEPLPPTTKDSKE